MKRTPNWKNDADLTDKCGSCKYYQPFIKKDSLTAREHCRLRNNTYKQRTDSCLKRVAK
jgi:hypothetical protein